MKIKVLLVIMAIALVGCEKEQRDVSQKYLLGDGLSDCNIYELRSESGKLITVVRCPNSSTSTNYVESTGKVSTTYNNMVVENES